MFSMKSSRERSRGGAAVLHHGFFTLGLAIVFWYDFLFGYYGLGTGGSAKDTTKKVCSEPAFWSAVCLR